jgi:DMSO reductase iron-sulfur subunit
MDFSVVDLVDELDLPLKNRIGPDGYYRPAQKGSGSCDSLIPDSAPREGEQYRFHFDLSKCVGCQCCVVACNEQNNNPSGVHWRRVGEIEGGVYPETRRFHLSMACNHCLDPSCLEGCPTDAYVKLADGIVKHKADECIGCGYCTWNCPYGVPQFNPERRIVTKCDMCHSRLTRGELPACVAACPESAIRIEKVNVAEWRANHTEADAPHVPDSRITLSTTRITRPPSMPQSMLRANRHRIEPAKPHFSLVFMTVLTQLASGGFLTLWLGDLFSRWVGFLRPLEDFLVTGALGMLGVSFLALFASVFHLGRPLHAYKALRMWRRSWLSREVLFFTLFAASGAVFSGMLLGQHFLGRPLPENLRMFSGGMVALLGMAGVFASARIYLVAARPAWNTIRTPFRFFLTGFILGPLFALVLYSVTAMAQAAGEMPGLGPRMFWLAVSGAAAFLQLFVLLWRLLYLLRDQPFELGGSTWLLTHRFRAHFLARILLLVSANFILPIWMANLLARGQGSAPFLAFLAVFIFLMALSGELLGRYLFFVTVVPKNMPGSFFAAQEGEH